MLKKYCIMQQNSVEAAKTFSTASKRHEDFFLFFNLKRESISLNQAN